MTTTLLTELNWDYTCLIDDVLLIEKQLVQILAENHVSCLHLEAGTFKIKVTECLPLKDRTNYFECIAYWKLMQINVKIPTSKFRAHAHGETPIGKWYNEDHLRHHQHHRRRLVLVLFVVLFLHELGHAWLLPSTWRICSSLHFNCGCPKFSRFLGLYFNTFFGIQLFSILVTWYFQCDLNFRILLFRLKAFSSTILLVYLIWSFLV